MFSLLSLISVYFKELLAGLSALITLYLFKRNSDLKKDNEIINQNLKESNKTIEIQQKVIDVTQNTKPTDLDGNLERMREDKL